jgi:hypothetical protein
MNKSRHLYLLPNLEEFNFIRSTKTAEIARHLTPEHITPMVMSTDKQTWLKYMVNR